MIIDWDNTNQTYMVGSTGFNWSGGYVIRIIIITARHEFIKDTMRRGFNLDTARRGFNLDTARRTFRIK